MMCALVPLTPKEETPARRGRPFAGHGTGSLSSRTSPEAQSTCGEGSSACSVAGSTWCRMARIILMIPATPAAAWVWPMLDFTEPSHSGWSSVCSWP